MEFVLKELDKEAENGHMATSLFDILHKYDGWYDHYKVSDKLEEMGFEIIFWEKDGIESGDGGPNWDPTYERATPVIIDDRW